MLWLLCLVVEASLTGLNDIVASSGGFSSLIPLLYPISHLLFLRNFQYFCRKPTPRVEGLPARYFEGPTSSGNVDRIRITSCLSETTPILKPGLAMTTSDFI
ncbi:hypothetical protein B0T13DRAFT_298972 [Neurospora crassa]|nr:hypothetical protein B0T13DRAFT_298972 [Neurospora crassa]